MNWYALGLAVALFLVMEGILPFLNPQGVRRLLEMVSTLSDAQLRFAGLTSMLSGLLLLFIINS